MTLLSTQYKTPRHPSYRSNPFTTIPHPTGNPLRAKKNPPSFTCTRIVSNLLAIIIGLYMGFTSTSVRGTRGFFFIFLYLGICKFENHFQNRNYRIKIFVHHDSERNVPPWKRKICKNSRKFAFRREKIEGKRKRK